MLRFMFFALAWMPTLSSSADYYRWVDEQGVIHYSDAPPAQKVSDLTEQPLPVFSNLAPPTPSAPLGIQAPNAPSVPPSPNAPPVPKLASQIQLVYPTNDASIHNNLGNIPIQIATDIPLAPGQTLRILLDGKAITESVDVELILQNVNRGEHSLVIQLLNENKVIAQTPAVTLYLHRAIVKPQKPTPR